MLLKTVALVLGLAAASTSFGYTTMVGREYNGQGTWLKPDGTRGAYGVRTTVTNTRVAEHSAVNITSNYNFGERSMRTTLIAVFNQKNNFHDIMATVAGEEGQEPTMQKVGSGYCINEECHYSAKIDDMVIEETITVVRNQMHKIGSKSIMDGETKARIMTWTEDLRAGILQPRP